MLGSDRSAFAMPLRSEAGGGASDSDGRGAVLITLCIACSLALIGLFAIYLCLLPGMSLTDRGLYFLLLLGLAYCCLSYQFNRYGASRRAARHRRFGDSDLRYLFRDDAPSVTILIPSYREERRVLLMTILSAALAQYSNRRIVLLVDDPPHDQPCVQRTLAAIGDVKRLLSEPVALLEAEFAAWRARSASGAFVAAAESARLAQSYRRAADWLEELADTLRAEAAAAFAHVDAFFVDRIVLDLARHYRRHAEALLARPLDAAAATSEYRRLAGLFCRDITGFERKTYENLSHAPNKAMNLNAYIGLMGGFYDVVRRGGARRIEAATPDAHQIAFAGSDYVLTLDADSVVVNDYLLTLVHILERNPAFGVAQTPYLTFPGARSAVERIAGATTDIQYLVHQGSTFFNASYWVGANALIRFAALRDICRDQIDGGKRVKVFIQDETVIEDTGATIDLLNEGWSVHNHFEPLAYSATPADFGALAIQRKRWSNGGLIILPMLLAYFLHSEHRLRRTPELALRANYLLSPVIGNAAVFLLMIWSSVDAQTLIWAPLIMLPYFVLYGLDLRRLGYRFVDIFGVCALNLMLLPVSFAGIFSSLRQIVTGRKGSFSRTPKVSDRTYIPPAYFLFNIAMLLLMVTCVSDGVISGAYQAVVVPAVNITLYAYGLYRFVGVRAGFHDLLSLPRRLADVAIRHAASASAGGGLRTAAMARSPRALGPALAVCALLLGLWHFGAGSAGSASEAFAADIHAVAQAAGKPVKVVATAAILPRPAPATPRTAATAVAATGGLAGSTIAAYDGGIPPVMAVFANAAAGRLVEQDHLGIGHPGAIAASTPVDAGEIGFLLFAADEPMARLRGSLPWPPSEGVACRSGFDPCAPDGPHRCPQIAWRTCR